MPKLFANLLIALMVVAGVYSLAFTIATATTGSLTNVETAGQSRLNEFTTALIHAASKHRAAIAKCELLSAAETVACKEAASTEQKRARAAARTRYRGNIKLAVAATGNEATVRNADPDLPDAAFYRAHRQLTDVRMGCPEYGNADVVPRKRKPFPNVAMK